MDSPLFLQLSPSSPPAPSDQEEEHEQDLPVHVYETIHSGGAPAEGDGWEFAELGWKIETGEAERIAVEGVGKAVSSSLADGETSSCSLSLHSPVFVSNCG